MQSTGLRSEPTRSIRPSWLLLTGCWLAVFLAVWSALKPLTPSPLNDPSYAARPVDPRADLLPQEKATIDVFREASPSVVHITSSNYRRDMFGLNIFEIPLGTGSGFIYDQEGHVVTNYHVVQAGSKWRIKLADGSDWDAELVGAEPDKDIAVLRIKAPAEQLRPIKLGTSEDLVVGQSVLAIGNPFGLDQTLTTGVVSALGREIESITGRKIRDVIQTDAAINPGNSGGPLLDSAGRLIGVNTQIASPSGASAGIGFAVPADIVNDIVPDLIRYGAVRRPTMGVTFAEDRIARRLGVRAVLIVEVVPGSGADEAGLRGTKVDSRGYIHQLGDIIIKVNDRDVRTGNELKDALESTSAGSEVTVSYVRDGEVKTAKVRLSYNE